MRYEAHAYRVIYALFVTLSLNDTYSMLITPLLVRTRESDPIDEADATGRHFDCSNKPSTEQELLRMGIPVSDWVETVPDYRTRRAILARRPVRCFRRIPLVVPSGIAPLIRCCDMSVLSRL